MVGSVYDMELSNLPTDENPSSTYFKAIEAGNNTFINSMDIVPVILFKERKKIEIKNEERKESHARTMRQTYTVHQLTKPIHPSRIVNETIMPEKTDLELSGKGIWKNPGVYDEPNKVIFYEFDGKILR